MMDWHLNSYAAAMFVTCAISFGLAMYVWRHRDAPGGAPLALLMAAIAEWAFGYAMELGSPTISAKLFWTNFNFAGIVVVPGAWLVFTLQYTHRERWLTRRNLILLAAPALLTLLLDWTNEWHFLIRSSVRLDTSGPIPMFDPAYAIGFWIFWGYTAATLLAGTLLIIHALLTSPGLYRGQAFALLLAALVPWIGNSIYLSGLSPFPKLDLTPPSFTIAGLLLAWGLYRYRLLDIVPVARDAVIESMSDGVVVLDRQSRVVDLNPAAQRIIGKSAAQVIGTPVHLALLDQPERYTTMVETQSEVTWETQGKPRTFNLSISLLYDRQMRLSGRLAILRDITERKHAEAALREYQQQLEESFQREQEKAQHNAQLYAEAQERARRLALLHDISMAVNSTLDLQTVLTRACQKLVENFKVNHSGVMLFDDERAFGQVMAEFPLQSAAGIRVSLEGYAAVQHIIQTAHPLAIYDAQHDPLMEHVWEVMRSLGVLSIMIVPLVIKDRVIGTFGLDVTTALRRFEPAEIELAQTIAVQLAMAIDNARWLQKERARIEYELETARQIQINLLPAAAPDVPGLDIAGMSRPARQVGGDFYNYFVFDQDHLGIAVGDVSGKGMQAALMMALSYGLLTTQVRRELAPFELLAALNVQIRPHTQRSKLNTALTFVGLKLAGGGWQLQVGNAGLVAPLVRRRDGKVEWWDVGGLPLGTMREEGKEYEELTQSLGPGDVLILSSDGIVEAMNPDRELYGFERLTACVERAEGKSAQAIQDYILDDVRAFVSGAEQHDDMTLVVVVIEANAS